ncbi:MAG: apolipoprotein N-acyltransferase [Candidatus Coatesbacteria bacterium]|nr:apolipoprotein N-acyltransferase [Candidatus Coatesbacteria bacterium]
MKQRQTQTAVLIDAKRLDGRVALSPPNVFVRLALILGGAALYVLSFPKAGIYGLAYFALVPLFTATRELQPAQAFRHWFAFMFLVNVGGFYWMAPITAPGFVVSAMLMALYTGLGGILAVVVYRKVPRVPWWLAAALAWAATEYIKSLGFYAFPWLAFGYSQARNLAGVQFAALFGVYGVSAVVIFFNALAAEALDFIRRRRFGKALTFFGVGVGLVVVVHLGGALALDEPEPTTPPVTAGIIQAGIAQDLKWDHDFRATGETYRIYQRQTAEVLAAAAEPPDLILWPESAASCYLEKSSRWLDWVRGIVNLSGCRHLVGTQVQDFDGPGGSERHFNAALLYEPGNPEPLERYYKIHLVPFSETIPFGKDIPIIAEMIARASDFDAGWRMPLFEVVPGRGAADWPPADLETPPLPRTGWMPDGYRPRRLPEVSAKLLPVPELPDEPVIAHGGLLICFESLYPEMALEYARNGADFLMVTTNDAWFRQSSMPEQHFEIAILRAVENRLPLLRAANAGISGFIDPWGRPGQTTPLDVEAGIVQRLPQAEGPTLYTRIGDLLPRIELGACLALALVAVYYTYRERRRRRKG